MNIFNAFTVQVQGVSRLNDNGAKYLMVSAYVSPFYIIFNLIFLGLRAVSQTKTDI